MCFCFFIFRFMKKLDVESLEELLERQEPLNGKEFRSILHKITEVLIDTNAHLDCGTRSYQNLFEK